MSVSHKKYVIIDIKEIKKAEQKVRNKIIMRKPEQDIFKITAVRKSWIEKSQQGFKLLEQLGYGDKLDQLNQEYLDTAEAFTAILPATSKSIEWNKYHLGGDIMIAYYPENVWATFHAKDLPDNKDEKNME